MHSQQAGPFLFLFYFPNRSLHQALTQHPFDSLSLSLSFLHCVNYYLLIKLTTRLRNLNTAVSCCIISPSSFQFATFGGGTIQQMIKMKVFQLPTLIVVLLLTLAISKLMLFMCRPSPSRVNICCPHPSGDSPVNIAQLTNLFNDFFFHFIYLPISTRVNVGDKRKVCKKQKKKKKYY